MTEENILPELGTTVPPDEIIKLQCLQLAIQSHSCDPLEMAKSVFKWVKEQEMKGVTCYNKAFTHDDNILGG